MEPIDLTGRVPRPRGTISVRLITTVVAVVLVLIFAVIYGFRYRLAKEQARKDAQHMQTSAFDAAQSNRKVVESDDETQGRLAALQKAERAAGGASNLPLISPVVDAAKNIAQPFPPQQQQSGKGAPNWQVPPPAAYPAAQTALSAVDIENERQKRAIEHSYTRLQAALEAPTGGQEQHATAVVAAVDPLQAEIAQFDQQLRQRVAASPPVSGAAVAPAVPTGIPESSYRAQNGQTDKGRFNEGGELPGDDYLKTTRTAPLSRWVVQRGTVIPAALPQRVVSDLPGDLIAEVQRDVYDSPTQKFVMIPAGSRLIGEYNSSVSYAQSRVQIVWTAIYFPDGSFIDLDRMPSHAADGASGLKDQVDNHWKRLISGVALSSVLAAGLQISQNRTNGSVLTYPSTGQEAASAIGTQSAELGQQITTRNLNIQPTLKIRPGEMFAVSVKRDMLFSAPYEPIGAR